MESTTIWYQYGMSLVWLCLISDPDLPHGNPALVPVWPLRLVELELLRMTMEWVFVLMDQKRSLPNSITIGPELKHPILWHHAGKEFHDLWNTLKSIQIHHCSHRVVNMGNSHVNEGLLRWLHPGSSPDCRHTCPPLLDHHRTHIWCARIVMSLPIATNPWLTHYATRCWTHNNYQLFSAAHLSLQSNEQSQHVGLRAWIIYLMTWCDLIVTLNCYAYVTFWKYVHVIVPYSWVKVGFVKFPLGNLYRFTPSLYFTALS